MQPAPCLPPRLPDWPERLYAIIEERERWPLGWGVHDCVAFGAACAAAMTGAAIALPTWRTEGEARECLRAAGGLVAAVTSVLGPPLRTPALAQRGDVLLVRVPPRPGARAARLLAVCDAGRWVAPGEHGLARGPIALARLAWAVGREA